MQTENGPTLEWLSLPELGADRHRREARRIMRQRLLAAMALAAIAAAIVLATVAP